MDHLCEKTDITLEWEMNGRYLVPFTESCTNSIDKSDAVG